MVGEPHQSPSLHERARHGERSREGSVTLYLSHIDLTAEDRLQCSSNNGCGNSVGKRSEYRLPSSVCLKDSARVPRVTRSVVVYLMAPLKHSESTPVNAVLGVVRALIARFDVHSDRIEWPGRNTHGEIDVGIRNELEVVPSS